VPTEPVCNCAMADTATEAPPSKAKRWTLTSLARAAAKGTWSEFGSQEEVMKCFQSELKALNEQARLVAILGSSFNAQIVVCHTWMKQPSGACSSHPPDSALKGIVWSDASAVQRSGALAAARQRAQPPDR
jgi:hypothetical protein